MKIKTYLDQVKSELANAKNKEAVKFVNYLLNNTLITESMIYRNNRSFSEFNEFISEIDLNYSTDNSYNWNSPVIFEIVHFSREDLVTDETKYYIALAFHLKGDVRGNYSDFVIFEGTLQNFMFATSDYLVKKLDDDDNETHVSIWGEKI